MPLTVIFSMTQIGLLNKYAPEPVPPMGAEG